MTPSPGADALVAAMPAALAADDQLALVYQPRVSLRDGACQSAEALLRWTHPAFGPVPPGVFVPIMEQAGLAGALTGWVIERALSDLVAWSAAGFGAGVAINVPAMLLTEDLVIMLTRQMRRHGLGPGRVELEVTEGSPLPAGVDATADALQQLGVRLAIDDFGTGYSSLRRLRDPPFDTLKIDQGFIRGLAANPRDRAIVRSTIELGHALGCRVVAEGIEDAASMALLAEWGCDEGQGYWIARPMPVADLHTWMGERPGEAPRRAPGMSPTRRGTLAGLGALCCARAWAQPAEHACAALPPEDPTIQAADRVHMLLAMALVHDGWCIDRSRPELLAAYAEAEPGRVFSDYLGHNIGALLVTPAGTIACFALNRNIECNSTLEHAEARAVQAATSLANAGRGPGTLATFQPPLRGARLLTTLEPCAQCSGIMDLAALGAVVFLQDDPATHGIADILHGLSCGRTTRAPRPERADFLPFRAQLQSAYGAFLAGTPPGTPRGLTAFLGTVPAYRIYREAAGAFDALPPGDGALRPVVAAAKLFRARWRGRIEEGGAPEMVRRCS